MNSNMIETFRYLSSVEGATVQELVTKVGVSERTIRRHLKIAESRFDGFTEEMEKGNIKRYFIRNMVGNLVFPTITSTQLQNLDIIQSTLTNEEQIHTMELVKAQVTNSISKKSTFLVDFNVLKEVELSPIKPQLLSPYNVDILKQIREALLGNNITTIDYIRRQDNQGICYERVYPLGIIWGTRNYLVITKNLGENIKPFFLALPNIQKIAILEDFFGYPKNFNIRTDYKHLFNNYNEEVLEYQLIFKSHKILGDIKEYLIHPTQKFTELEEGKTEVSFQVSGIDEVFNFILSWGNRVTIIAPIQLKEKVKNYNLPNI